MASLHAATAPDGAALLHVVLFEHAHAQTIELWEHNGAEVRTVLASQLAAVARHLGEALHLLGGANLGRA